LIGNKKYNKEFVRLCIYNLYSYSFLCIIFEILLDSFGDVGAPLSMAPAWPPTIPTPPAWAGQMQVPAILDDRK
jgi:hypothetical protein